MAQTKDRGQEFLADVAKARCDRVLFPAPNSGLEIFPLEVTTMKLIKSLLLGTAAGFAAVAGAQAADLPSKKAAPVEYVRVCSAYGAGFFFLPGTETCLRVGGRVRAEYAYGERWRYGQDALGFRGRGQVRLDARTQTAYGTLRTFINFEATNDSGPYGRNLNSQGLNAVAGTPVGAGSFANGRAGQLNIAAAFIQFGPITAGRAQSFFDFYADALNWGPAARGSDATVNLLAYTATFGGGFSATLSLEDGTERQVNAAGFNPAGATYPDVVGQLNLTQAWGSAQLSGAFHQITSLNRVPAAVNPLSPYVDSTYGWAVQGGIKINLPMLAAGDVFWLQAAYAQGAISYLGYGGAGYGTTWGANTRIGEVDVINSDAVVSATGRANLSTGWVVTAGLLHYWAPTVRQGVYGSYSSLSYGSAATGASSAPVVGNIYASGSTIDSSEFRVGSNLIWSPVAGLDIGVEVIYIRAETKGRVVSSKAAALGLTSAQAIALGQTRSSDDAWQGRLRIQRDF
jgi:hypothetical protein